MAFRAFCDRDRPVAYPVPTYSLYPILSALQDCPAVEVPFDEEFNLPGKLGPARAALKIVCNPNAPSGTLISADELASLADETQGVLLIDEAYVDFAETDCMALVVDFDNVIVLRSMSKAYSMAGLRFGYAVASPDLVAGLMKVKDSYNVDAVSLSAATAAIGDRDYLAETVEKIKRARGELALGLREIGLEVGDSSANFVLAGCPDRSAKALHERLAARNIYVRHFDVPGLADKLRITVGTDRENAALLAALKEILSS
jgi:histidinol-phosphate aminotransferase